MNEMNKFDLSKIKKGIGQIEKDDNLKVKIIGLLAELALQEEIDKKTRRSIVKVLKQILFKII